MASERGLGVGQAVCDSDGSSACLGGRAVGHGRRQGPAWVSENSVFSYGFTKEAV